MNELYLLFLLILVWSVSYQIGGKEWLILLIVIYLTTVGLVRTMS